MFFCHLFDIIGNGAVLGPAGAAGRGAGVPRGRRPLRDGPGARALRYLITYNPGGFLKRVK
jgi:hypothetical protein